MRITLRVFLLFFIFVVTSFAGSPDSLELGHFAFEVGENGDWVNDEGKPAGEIAPNLPRSGKGCLHIDMKGKGAGSFRYRNPFVLPVLKEPQARMVRVNLWVRTQDVHPGEMSVVFIKRDAQGQTGWFFPGYQNYRDYVFMALPASSEWTNVQRCEMVGEDVRELTIYLRFENRSGKAQVWVDDLTVELLDRGLIFDEQEIKESLKGTHVFSGEGATMKLKVSGADNVRSGTVNLFDEEDRVLGTVPIAAGQRSVAVELPTRGYYGIRANVIYHDGIQAELRTSAAVVGPKIPEAMLKRSPFGLCGPWWGELVKLAGARWDRFFFSWQRDDYQQAAATGYPADRKPVAQYVSPADRDMVVVFCQQPDWFQDRQGKPFTVANTYYPPKDWNRFGDFVRYVMRSIQGKANYVEIANEPDEWQGSWKEFARYASVMRQAIKSVNPQAKLLAPGFCNIDLARVKAVADAGLLEVIDGFSIHAYVKATAPEEEYIQKVRDLKAYLASVGKKKLPIFLTEYGWTIPPGDWQQPVDPLTQARYVSRSSILLVAEQIPSFVYFLAQVGEGPTVSASGYALLNWESNPRPGFAAFANVARMLTGVEGAGRVLKLTPTTYLALFQKGSGTMAAIWDVAGPANAYIPQPWSDIRDMQGRPMKGSPDGMLSISPSPIFVQIADSEFYKMSQARSIDISQGEKLSLPFDPVWVPAALKVQDRKLTVPQNTPKGTYCILGKTSAGWRCFILNVIMNIEILKTSVYWPINEAKPKLLAVLRSNLTEPVDIVTEINLQGGQAVPGVRKTLVPSSTVELVLPLPALESARRYLCELKVLGVKKSQPKIRSFAPLDLTIIPCLSVIRSEDVKKIPAMNFSVWGPFANYEPVKNVSPGDCSAQLQAGYGDDGLYLRITVRDNVHRQTQDPKNLWKHDSVQIALDLDAEKPWQANVGGCNGHFKVFEYGFALGQNGPMNWRWISYDKSLPTDTDEKRIQPIITRRDNETLYEILLPWPTLGLMQKPQAGASIGFSLTVNDVDGDEVLHGLRLGDGIFESKDPVHYGTFRLR